MPATQQDVACQIGESGASAELCQLSKICGKPRVDRKLLAFRTSRTRHEADLCVPRAGLFFPVLPPFDLAARVAGRRDGVLTDFSRAAMRFLSASFSRRAAAAMALTASNSSRVTSSMLLKIRSNWSRNRTSTSSRTPCRVPRALAATRAKSSRILLSVCIPCFTGLSVHYGPARSGQQARPKG